jgi:glycosyltransferase involved in cell wall biosynthesis
VSIDLDFYLSEMSVSDRHGGGLTLQRVLGADLDHIGFFVHVSRFATDLPASTRFAARCLDMPMWTEANITRRTIGYTQAAWLSRRPAILRAHARRVASAISARIPKETLRGLVCPQGAASLYTVETLATRRQIEYVTWMMDDHLVRWREGQWHYPPHLEELFARHIRRARSVFVISPVMARLYRERFGVESQVLFGSSDPGGEPQREIQHDNGQLRLGYFGSVGPWQLDALGLLGGALESANAKLDIYTAAGSFPQPLQIPRVEFRGGIPPAEIAATMRSYDAVVLPVSFDPALRHMSELNIATKMSECLASGTVTLFIGPEYAAMARYLEGEGAALLVTDAATGTVADAVAQLRDRERRTKLLEAARNLVKSRLSVRTMRQIWLDGVARLS